MKTKISLARKAWHRVRCLFGFHRWKDAGVGTLAVQCGHCGHVHVNR